MKTTNEPQYPLILIAENECTIIQTSVLSVQILYKGQPQGVRQFATHAIKYAIAEGLFEETL